MGRQKFQTFNHNLVRYRPIDSELIAQDCNILQTAGNSTGNGCKDISSDLGLERICTLSFLWEKDSVPGCEANVRRSHGTNAKCGRMC